MTKTTRREGDNREENNDKDGPMTTGQWKTRRQGRGMTQQPPARRGGTRERRQQANDNGTTTTSAPRTTAASSCSRGGNGCCYKMREWQRRRGGGSKETWPKGRRLTSLGPLVSFSFFSFHYFIANKHFYTGLSMLQQCYKPQAMTTRRQRGGQRQQNNEGTRNDKNKKRPKGHH